jgi:uncharacterized membrane protein YfhO
METSVFNCHDIVFSVRRTSRKFGFKEVSEDEDWSLYWTDYSVALERVMDMKKYQVSIIMASYI